MFDSTASAKRKTRIWRGLDASLTLLLWVAVISVATQPACAYVDPGSGLFALQLIGTSIAGAIFLIRRRLRSLIRSLHRGRSNERGRPE